MPDYMVTAAFTNEPDATLLSAERERLKELVSEEILRVAYLSADRSAAWLVVRGDGSCAVEGTMESLPLYPYMEIRKIVEVQEIMSPSPLPELGGQRGKR